MLRVFAKFRPLFLWLTASALCLCSYAATTPLPGVGLKFDTLPVGKKEYHDVTIRQVTARSIAFVHADGIGSALLRELSPELQAKFGYDPAADRAAEEKLTAARQSTEARLAKAKAAAATRNDRSVADTFSELLQHFGEAPELAKDVDLRPRFFELGLSAKDQGRRPSCAVFAVVSALEFQEAQLSGTPEKLSEEYLIWAVRRATRRAVATSGAQMEETESDANDTADAGFTLGEVVAALRAYGIPTQTAMPSLLGTRFQDIPDPTTPVIEQARSRRRVFIHSLPGRDPAARLANIVHALNAGVPVAIGMRWPHQRTIWSGYLSEQKPILDYAHAVTLVGYRCPDGQLEHATFIFKNSYGATWGQGGFGLATFGYLRDYLLDAVLLEVQRNAS